MNEEAAYNVFVERYFESGDKNVPDSWPRGLRKRCIFFLRLMEKEPAIEGVTSSLAHLGGRSEQAPPPLEVRHERYALESEIAHGGMGRVFLAYDRDFRRRIALKVMLGDPRDPERASRFVQEAQTTAQLEHPNIGPVYDIGVDARGAPFFTMKWIRGRNFAAVLRSGGEDFTLTRLVQILQQAAMAVHFAHVKGVIHRDLKPQNIMVGDFGEVLVVDWGLAKVAPRPAGPESKEAISESPAPESPALLDLEVSTLRAEGGEHTLEGSVQGSLPYMAPEQARGEVGEIDARTDVFGLGAILYEVLTASPPHVAESPRALLALARRGTIVPPAERAPGRSIPRILDEIARKALAARKEDRYRDARELHQALQDYLEGIHSAERQAAEASRLLWVAEKLHGELRAAEGEEVRLREEESAIRAPLKSFDPAEKKSRAWEVAERCAEAREAVDGEFARTTAAYLAVLSISPGHRAARARLAELFYGRLLAAEERGEREAAALYKGLVMQYHDGQYAAELSGQGLLCLESSPAGATVLLCRFEEKSLVFREGAWETAGTTPLEKALPQGSYLAVVWKEGFAEVRYPFVIDRRGTHRGKVRLVPGGTIPEGFVQVPGGLTVAGTDSRDFPSCLRRRIDLPEFFVGRFPVTFGEYCAFLNDRYPGVPGPPPELQSFFGREEYIVRGEQGFAPASKLDPRMAVTAVTRAGAMGYAAWMGQRLGKRLRLLSEDEWERCARGSDGRLYPWGNGFDWALCKGALSRPGEPFPDPVGSFPSDVSVFGVRDLAGAVRELCDGWAGEGYRPCKGGSWFNPFPFAFRADFRTVQRDGNRSTDVGFRVGYAEEPVPGV